ncbi:MAG: recombinase RecA [Oligoflexia bacterium]|nr:recombinase RecA [Oligoflexia bacterium]
MNTADSKQTSAAPQEKGKALTTAISELERRYGRGAIMNLGTSPGEQVEAFSTGSLGLDIALGIGGLPHGRIIEIYGPESSGKTTLALHVAAEVQKKGGTVVFIDAEHALDVNYAKKLGVDTGKLLVSQPDCGEQALEICDTLVQTGSVDLVIVDSVAALVPRAEIDGEMDDQQPGLQARLMSKALRKMTGIAAKSNCSIIFINQIRMKIGVMFGSPETTTGGNALKFYASVRLDVRRIGSIKEAGTEEAVVLGNRVRVKVVKNKVAPPFREAEFDVIFNEGICKYGEILDLGVDKGVLDKAGAWYSFKGERLGQGRDGSKLFLKEHPEIAHEIRALILGTVGIGASLPEAATSQSNLKSQVQSVEVDSKKGAAVGQDKSGKQAPKKKSELNGTAASAA